MTAEPMTAVEALLTLVRRHIDAEAARELINSAAQELNGHTTASPAAAPLVQRRVVEHALRRPVPCPKCSRTTPCKCGADRTEGRITAVLDALAPWLTTDTRPAA
jgi:hypothetical protein